MRRWVSFSVLFCAALSFCLPLTAQGKSLTPTSPPLEPLWQTLLQLTGNLPTQIEALRASLTEQIGQLQASNSNLQQISSDLQASNQVLTQQNADLKNSLAQSQTDLATSIAAQKQLQTSLAASTTDIIKAQGQAKALEAQVSVLKIGCITMGVGLGAVAVYEGGHLLKVW